jgi:hypothetical protein
MQNQNNSNQAQVQGAQISQDVDLNEFMLRMIEVLNKRFGGVLSQINSIDRKVSDAAAKTELESLKSEHETTKAALVSKIAELESEVRKLKAVPAAPTQPKVNRNILKHLE